VCDSRISGYSLPVAVAVMAILAAASAQAQEQTTAAENPNATPADQQDLAEVIVTGTSKARRDLSTPLVATSINSEKLESLASNGPADILSTIPSLKAEGGGGEVATNVFVAGLPSSGQYQFTPLEFNGIQVIGSMGLNSSAPDVYYRTDLGIDRLEFVRGGVSNLFGGGGIGGLINYIDKTGSDTTHGVGQLELSDHDRIRGDFAASGPLANNLYYAVSGFYRYDNGPLVSGFPTDGYQLRGNFKRTFDSGEFKIYWQAIDDKDQFYGDIPLTRGFQLARGNNGHLVTTTETSALDNMSFLTPGGVFNTAVEQGAATRGGSVGVDFNKDLGDGWGFNGRGNIADYHHTFALFSGGDNITNLPVTQAGFLQSYGYSPSLYTGTFTYADSGAPVPSNYLLWGDRVQDRDRPLNTATGELNLTKELLLGDWSHHFTLGGFWGQTRARDYDITYSYIGDFDNAPKLVDVTVKNDATDAQTIVSSNGMVHAGLGYVNNYYDARRYATYFADQTEFGNWILDLGGRYENLTGDVRREETATYTTNTTPNLSPLLSQVTWGDGHFLDGTVNPTAWAAAAGALYKLDPHSSLFLNVSRGFFMPNLNSVQIDTNDDVQSFEAEIIKQYEGGYKYAGGIISGSISPFFTTLSNRRNVSLLNGPVPGSAPVEVVNLISTRSYGVEGVFNVHLTDYLSFESNATYEHDIYTQYTPVAACIDCVGNVLQRQPNVLANYGLYYRQGGIDASIFDTYTGRTFTSDLNNIELPGFHIARLNLGYTKTFAGGDSGRIGVDIYNLFDSHAVTEGSPRQGTEQTLGAAYFVGRQVLPRRVLARLTYNF
jgi:iron complex outermembrane recepter protein